MEVWKEADQLSRISRPPPSPPSDKNQVDDSHGTSLYPELSFDKRPIISLLLLFKRNYLLETTFRNVAGQSSLTDVF